MNLKEFTVGEIMTRCYIISNNNNAVVIDPGAEGKKIYNYLIENNLKLEYIINTHAHFDHIAANEFLKNKTGAKILAHPKADSKLTNSKKNLSLSFLNKKITSPGLDIVLKNKEKIDFEGIILEIIYTPGHSEDGISIYIAEENILFSGDCIFASGIGRTDLEDSNFRDLKKSIENKLLTLPEETEFYAGHGPKSSIKDFKTKVWPSFR